jgi:hypothetical protein
VRGEEIQASIFFRMTMILPFLLVYSAGMNMMLEPFGKGARTSLFFPGTPGSSKKSWFFFSQALEKRIKAWKNIF